jgi:hypothetical protein
LAYVVHGYGLPQSLSSTSISSITHNSAALSGSVSDDNGDAIEERGFCYSKTDTTPDTGDSKKVVGSGEGSFSGTITGLDYGTKYYVRTYAINSAGTSYGAVATFTTVNPSASVTNTVSFTIGNSIPLTFTNVANLYVQALTYVNGVLIKTQNLGQTTSGTLTFDGDQVNSMYSQIPNTTSCPMYVRLKTYSDSGYSTQVGANQDKTGTASVNQTTNKPTFTTFTVGNLDKTVANTDKYSNVLVSSSTSTLLGADTKMIKGFSKLRAVVTSANKMVALNSATAIKYRFSAGSLYNEQNYSADSTVNLDIDNATTNSVSVTAYDSRSLTTTVADASSITYNANYSPVSLWGLTLTRDNSVDSQTKLKISGSYWKEYFGGGSAGVQNTRTAHYRYKETTDTWGAQTWTAITLTDTDGSLSCDDYINGDLGASGFDTEKSFDIEVRLYDKLTNIIVEGTLSVGIPVIDITSSGISIMGKYDSDEGGDIQIGGIGINSIDTDLTSVSANDDTLASAKSIRTAIDNGVLYGKNRQAIINGNFDVWQRGTSFAATTTAIFLADRWKANPSGGTATYSRQAFTVGQTDVPNNPTYFLRWQCTSADDNVGVFQSIEEVSSFAGQTITVSFYCKADTNRTIKLGVRQYFGSGGSADVNLDAQTASITSSWTLITFQSSVPSISGKTVGAGSYLQIQIVNPNNQTHTIDIASVQVCKGSVALPFCPKTYQEELYNCMRYYQIFSIDNYVGYADGNQLAVPFYGAAPLRLTGDLKAYAVTLSAIYAHRVNTTTVVTLYAAAAAMTGSTYAVNYGTFGQNQGWIEWTGAITEDIYVMNNSSTGGNQVSGAARFYIDVEL